MSEANKINTMVNQTTAPDTIPHLELRDVFERVRPEMARLEADDLLQITVDPVTAAGIARGALMRLNPLREQMAALPDFDIRNLDNLGLYARAVMQANAVYLGASSSPQHFQELVAEAAAVREQMVSDATALAKRGYLDGAVLDKLKGAVGHRNVATDLLTLVNVIRANWEAVAGKTALSAQELERAECLSDQLVNDIGERAVGPATIDKIVLERQQAYTVLVNAYDELRRAVTYLRWNYGDEDAIAPSLFGGKRRKSTADNQLETEPATATPQTNTTAPAAGLGNPPTAAASTASSAPTRVAAGLPGADPFTN
ncbi:MAG TPA: hypothetical protein VKP30_19495 [Polyangiaceae bacterium]|nr:hypothetical protein [Polyangiaceae bacterium]